MMDLMEEIVEQIAINLHGDTKITVGDHLIDLKGLGSDLLCLKP